jgi:Na+/proline symporter
VGLSYFATMFSTLTYLGVLGELVRHGPMILAQLIGLPVVYLLVGRTLAALVPCQAWHDKLQVMAGFW